MTVTADKVADAASPEPTGVTCTLSVGSMTCASYVRRIAKALSPMDRSHT
jgi:hypothetical protein